MNYTPEQERDIARLQELGALVTDARGLTNNLNTQTFSAKNAFREETLAEDRDTTGAFFALAIASIAYLSHVFDFTSAAIVMMALIALDILLCHMNKKAGNA